MLKDVLIIDNYDSFTYNLVQYVGALGASPRVVRNDHTEAGSIQTMMPEAIIISPGPGTPEHAGISLEVIRRFHGQVPILGVCLGHQAIGQAFGGVVCGAGEIRHGKTSAVCHDGDPLFAGLERPFQATRYHSLIVERHSLPESIAVTAWTDSGMIMGLRVAGSDTVGVQFHPESYASENGMNIMENFLCCQN